MKGNLLAALVKKIKSKRQSRMKKVVDDIRSTRKSRIICNKLKYVENANNEYELYSGLLKESGPEAANKFLSLHDCYSSSSDEYEDLLSLIDETRKALDSIKEREAQKMLRINYLKYLLGTKTLSTIALDLNLTSKETKKIYRSDKFRKENKSLQKLSIFLGVYV